MIINLTAMLEGKHQIESLSPQKNLIKKIENQKPDIIYISIGGYEHNQIVEHFKGSEAVIVSHVTPYVDIYINDEPEEVFPALVKTLEVKGDLSNVPGITFKTSTKKADTWDINKASFSLTGKEFLALSTRSCKGKCSFCSIANSQGQLRYRGIASTVAEIKSFRKIDRYIGNYSFADCSFDSNPPNRMKQLLKELIAEDPTLTFGANFRPDFHKMADEELINLLFYAGNIRAFIGVESANGKDLRLYNKKTTAEDSQKTIELFKNNDASIDIGFINLNPFSTFEGIKENVEFLRKNHLTTFETLTRKLTLGDAPIKDVIKKAGLLLPDGVNYKFQDENVTLLVNVLNLVERELHKNALANHSQINLDWIKRLKRKAFFEKREEEFMLIQTYEQKVIAIKNEASDRLSEWFTTLLNIIEQNKPYEELFTMTDEYINNIYLKATVKEYHLNLKLLEYEIYNLRLGCGI